MGTMLLGGASLAAAKGLVDVKLRWKMVLAWTRDMELFKRGAIRFARRVSLLSESRLAVDVHVAPPGTTPAEILAMVRSGEADCVHGFARDLAHVEPALEWFSSMPFGLSPRGYDAWLYGLGGDKLWKEACVPLGFYPRSMGDTGPVRLGWSRRELADISDFKGLALPAQGVAAMALAHHGARPQAPQDGVPTVAALASGRLDAASWHGAFHEREMGLPTAAPVSWGPAWANPAGRMMLCLNRKAFEALPAILRIIIDSAAVEEDHRLSTDFRVHNARAEAELAARGRTQHRETGAEALAALRRTCREAAADLAGATPLARRVRDSYFAALADPNINKE